MDVCAIISPSKKHDLASCMHIVAKAKTSNILPHQTLPTIMKKCPNGWVFFL